MPNARRTARSLSVVTALGLAAITSAQAHLVEDFGVRRGAPAHISLSTGFNGFVGAGIKKIQVDGVQMDAFCIDPFTIALRSSPGYRFVPLTKAPEAPFTLSASEATEISDLWAMFYNPGMKENKAAGVQLAIWEIVGGDDFSVIGKDYGASPPPGPTPPPHNVPDGGSTFCLFAVAIMALLAINKIGYLVPAFTRVQTRR